MLNKKKIVFLSGGTGTPKLLLGMKKFLQDEEIIVIGNTGDDEEFYGLLVSPDIDTILYLFAKQLALEKFWGVAGDSFQTLQQLEALGEYCWFKLGDKDLALHLLRNKLKDKGMRNTEIVQELRNRLAISEQILPMTDDTIRTKLISLEGKELSFQEYTVKLREEVAVREVHYFGSKTAQPTKEVIEAIRQSKAIIIGPSNPITSIGPMLSIKGFKEALETTPATIIAISPVEQGEAFSGPAAKLLEQLGFERSAVSVAKIYQSFLDSIIISTKDSKLKKDIDKLGIRAVTANISLKTQKERENLAKKTLQEVGYPF